MSSVQRLSGNLMVPPRWLRDADVVSCLKGTSGEGQLFSLAEKRMLYQISV